jgi:hypothetical protein
MSVPGIDFRDISTWDISTGSYRNYRVFQFMNRSKRFSKVLAVVALTASTLCVSATAAASGTAEAQDRVANPDDAVGIVKTHPRQKTYMKRKWGVEVLWVRTTAAGYMLEFRYKVLDAEKAKPLFVRQDKPVLIHEKSGSRMIVPTPGKVGALRNSNTPKEGTVYWMFFANPGKYVKPGDQVSIQIGDYLQQHLVVQ